MTRLIIAAAAAAITIALPACALDETRGGGGGGAGGETAVSASSTAVSTAASSGSGGAVACTENEKMCGDRCVSLDATHTGCAAESCEPCTTAHAVPVCDGQTCFIGTCVGYWHDCNMATEDGCESDGVTDPLNCGTCGNVCKTGLLCVYGVCK